MYSQFMMHGQKNMKLGSVPITTNVTKWTGTADSRYFCCCSSSLL